MRGEKTTPCGHCCNVFYHWLLSLPNHHCPLSFPSLSSLDVLYFPCRDHRDVYTYTYTYIHIHTYICRCVGIESLKSEQGPRGSRYGLYWTTDSDWTESSRNAHLVRSVQCNRNKVTWPATYGSGYRTVMVIVLCTMFCISILKLSEEDGDQLLKLVWGTSACTWRISCSA